MKTLMAAVAFATVLAAPAFAQSVNPWGWKGALAAPTSATSAYAAASFKGRRGAQVVRRGPASALAYARNCNISPSNPLYRTNCN